MCIELDDMLTPLYPDMVWKTRFWASGDVQATITHFTATRDKPPGFFLGKLKYYAETGFKPWIGKDKPIRAICLNNLHIHTK